MKEVSDDKDGNDDDDDDVYVIMVIFKIFLVTISLKPFRFVVPPPLPPAKSVVVTFLIVLKRDFCPVKVLVPVCVCSRDKHRSIFCPIN